MKKFVTFEGGEGAGKSTIISMLCQYLCKNNIEFESVREPGGLKLCEDIRSILKYSTEPMSKNTEFLLFSASRAELVNSFIVPKLNEGKFIVCDRFFDSSRVYQGYANGIDDDVIMSITNFATNGLVPSVTFFLDIDPEVAFLRKGGRDNGDRIEARTLDFHKKVREGYLNIAKKEDRFVILDATQPPQTILEKVINKLKEVNIL